MNVNNDSMADLQAELERAKLYRKIKQEKRKTIEDAIGFWTNKIAGGGLAVSGGLEIIVPDFLPVVFAEPTLIFGGGLALLVSTNAVNQFGKVLDALRSESEND